MIELKNITSFKEFIFEASIPGEFSNQTGFAESLVGRGIFSLLRYIKQGVDYMRLEYLKRKLENEYFAGWLRFCALKQIDLKEGTMPETKGEEGQAQIQAGNEQATGGGEEPTDTELYCKIFNYSFDENTTITELKSELQTAKTDLEEMIADTTNYTQEERTDMTAKLQLINNGLKYCESKLKMNLEVFQPLNNLVTDTGLTFDDNSRDSIMTFLERIKEFLNGDAKVCPNYKLTVKEINLLKNLKTCTNPEIKTRIDELNAILNPATPVPVPVVADSYKYVNEAMTSGINKSVPITQMLGDVLSTDQGFGKANPYDYLKKMGINGIEDINFQKTLELWKDKGFRDEATKLVNIDGIKKIQYAASRYIYRIKKTPTRTGITPEVGGGVKYEEDSALRTAWEKKVEKVRSEWTNFLNMDTVDPFKVLAIQEAFRKNVDGYKSFYNSTQKTTDDIVSLSKWKDIGLTLVENAVSVKSESNFIVECFVNGIKYHIILNMTSSVATGGGTIKTYRYVGNVDIKKILEEEIWKKNPSGFQSTLKDYVSLIADPDYMTNNFNDINTGFNFVINDANINKIGSHFLHGIHFVRRDPTILTISSNDTGGPVTNNTKIVFLYTDKTDNFLQPYKLPGTASAANFKLRVYKNGIVALPLPDLNIGTITELNDLKFGRLALINPTFTNYYFPPRYNFKPESINGSDASRFITFK